MNDTEETNYQVYVDPEGYGELGELLMEIDGKLRDVWSAELMRSI